MQHHAELYEITCSGCDHDHHGHGQLPGYSKHHIIIGSIFFAAAVLIPAAQMMTVALFLISYLLIGGDVVYKAVRNIGRGQVFDENFLMSLATFGAFLIGEYPEAVAVMLFYKVGEFFQDRAVDQSQKSIAALMDIKPEFATVLKGGMETKTDPSEVPPGTLIRVKPGEKVPIDGIVTEGFSSLDTSALTGESKLRDAEPGERVLSGSINTTGVLTIRTETTYGESTVSKIIELVKNASHKKANTEKFITTFARYYTPAVVFLAALLALVPPLVLADATFSEWIYRALVFLVISCPCALVISIPLGFFGGIGAASRNGILIKGGNYLEALHHVDTVIFDKTGTLTTGQFAVMSVQPEPGFTEEQVGLYASLAESYSSHPIAAAIRKQYPAETTMHVVADYQDIPGRGIKAMIDGWEVHLGNDKMAQAESLHGMPEKDCAGKDCFTDNADMTNAPDAGQIPVYLWIDRQFAGSIMVADQIKEEAASAVDGLKKAGIGRIMMFSGDRQNIAQNIAQKIGITEWFGQMLPSDKLEKLETVLEKQKDKHKVAFVGDGINDAPALARADVGIAMGGIGSDAAIEAADIVLMQDSPKAIVTAITIARKTKAIVWQNIILALGVKGIIMILGALGIAGMWEAIFADVGVALLAILNAIRILSYREHREPMA